METKAHHVLIGVFTLLVIAGAFVLIWFVSGAGGLMSGHIYQVRFKGTVGGLVDGSVVSFNGLRVGEVLSVGLVADDPGAVAATIKVSNDTPVRGDTRAKLESQGLGGAATIALFGGSPGSPELKGENGKWLPGVAPVAMQEGKAAARNIACDLKREPRKNFHYGDKGSLATIGRSAGIAQFGKLHISGFIAWLSWLFVHIFFLIGFRNRVLVFIQWAWSYFTYERGARLITGDTNLPGWTEPPPEETQVRQQAG